MRSQRCKLTWISAMEGSVYFSTCLFIYRLVSNLKNHVLFIFYASDHWFSVSCIIPVALVPCIVPSTCLLYQNKNFSKLEGIWEVTEHNPTSRDKSPLKPPGQVVLSLIMDASRDGEPAVSHISPSYCWIALTAAKCSLILCWNLSPCEAYSLCFLMDSETHIVCSQIPLIALQVFKAAFMSSGFEYPPFFYMLFKGKVFLSFFFTYCF